MSIKKQKRLTKKEWKIIQFALSNLIAGGGVDLQAFGDKQEEMTKALYSADLKVCLRG
tara:strand:- start:1133 stop:1306 length:174 start_codon:yes stop_codon:yes gene_type:complete